MLQEEFFRIISAHYESDLPFVAYRKPDVETVTAILQKDVTVYHSIDFTESGFLFAPFNTAQDSILFPLEKSDHIYLNNLALDVPKSMASIDLHTNTDRAIHMSLVEKAIEKITIGELEKVVISRAENINIPNLEPIELFKALLGSYDSAMVYIWFHPKVGLWLGASPETLLKVEGKRYSTMSLAGTQKYEGSLDVPWDEKNLEEQNVVTSYINDVLEPFSTQQRIGDLHTHKAGELLHLRCEISGVLKEAISKELIASLHPTPAVCGIPTELAKDFILENENYDREFYTGYLGELNFKTTKSRNANRKNVENNAYAAIKSTSDLYVNLRCMQLKDQNAIIYVGGGITKDSNTETEWIETVNKAQTMMRVLS